MNLHITTYLQGGAGKIICDLMENQYKNNEDVICLTNDCSYPGYFNYPEYEQRLNDIGIPLIKINGLFKREPTSIIEASHNLLPYLSSRSIRIIHSHSSIPSLCALIARNALGIAIPIIQTMHGWGTNKTPFYEKMDTTILSKIDKIVTVSMSSKHLLINKGLNKKKIQTIYNGIPEKPVKKKSYNGYKSIPKDAYIISCIGSVCERKNQKILIEAIKRILANKNINIYCLIVGEKDTEYAKKLIHEVKTASLSDRIIFTGYMENAEQVLSFSDVFVLPSLSEGLPLSIIEGFKEKVVVISSNIPECKELIKPEQNGFLFESNSTDSLKKMLLKVIGMPSERKVNIIHNAYDCYQKNFSTKIMLNSYKMLYQKCINNYKTSYKIQ